MKLLKKLSLCLTILILFSCNRAEEPYSKKTFPVKGKITVDGKEPGSPVQVKCHNVGKIDTKHPTASGCKTANDGSFEISTYTTGDGIPEGDYTLTFQWKKYNSMSRGYSGPDKLKKRYDKAENSTIKFSVIDGKSTDLGVIDLTTK